MGYDAMDETKKEVETSVNRIARFILAAFPSYTIHEIKNMNAGQLMHHVVLAERVLERKFEFEE